MTSFSQSYCSQARRDRLIKMQQKDQENTSVTPKKHWKQLPSTKGDASSPSVATRSAVFQNKVKEQVSYSGGHTFITY